MSRALATTTAWVLAGALCGCSWWSAPTPEQAEISAEDPPAPAVDLADQSVSNAEALMRQGLLDQAREEFERAIAVNPRLVVAYLGAGDIHRKRGDNESAEKLYARAAEIEPSNFDAQYKHGLTLQLLNRLTEAVRAYLRALTIRPDDFNANLNLATAYLQLGEAAQGLPYAERAVRLKPDDAAARTNLGALYAALDRHADAIIEYQQAAELTELTAPVLLNLADSLGKVGRYEEMVATLREVVRDRPSAPAWERLGSGAFRLRDYDEAERAFRRALEIDPNHYPALNGVGVCLLNRYVWSDFKDAAARDEAVAVLRRSLLVERRQPRIVELLTRYGR